MYHCSKLYTLYLTLAISSQIEHVVAQFVDFEYLSVLCERKQIGAKAKNLLADVQCHTSMFPSCSRIDPAAIKSLKAFNEFICAQPREACKNITATFKCQRDQSDCRRNEQIRDETDVLAFTIGYDYGQLNCMIKESEDENITRMCVKKDGLKVPQEPKAFFKWYFEEADMNKLYNVITFCDKRAVMEVCSYRSNMTMTFCNLGDKYTDALLKYKLKLVGYSDIPKAAADYCREDMEVWTRLSSLYGHTSDSFWPRYNLCHLKDPSSIELEYSTALCYSREKEGKDCFLQKTGPLPTEKSQILEWLCRENFSLSNSDPTVKSDLFQVAKYCFKDTQGCRQAAVVRQMLCLPVKNVSRTVSPRKLAGGYFAQEYYNELENFKCLLAVDEKVTNSCSVRVANGMLLRDRVKTAVCNSNQHFYELNITECLLSHKMDPEYISSCRRELNEYYDEGRLSNIYESIKSCTVPLYGKEEVENCSFKHLNRSLWTSREEFLSWFKSHEGCWPKLKALKGCFNILRRSKKLDEKYDKCRRTVQIKLDFEDLRRISCKRENGDLERVAALVDTLNCKVKLDTFHRTGECSKAFDNFKSIKDIGKFKKWLCEGEGKNGDDFVQLDHCSGEIPKDKKNDFYKCREEMKYVTPPATNVDAAKQDN